MVRLLYYVLQTVDNTVPTGCSIGIYSEPYIIYNIIYIIYIIEIVEFSFILSASLGKGNVCDNSLVIVLLM